MFGASSPQIQTDKLEDLAQTDQLDAWHRVYQLFEFCEGGIVLSLCLGKVKLCSQIV